jgi:cell division protein FtsA
LPKKLLHGIILTVTNSNSKGENMHYTAILDIGSSKVTCIICSKGGSDMPVVMHGVGMCEYSGYRTGDFIESNLPDEKSLETAVKRVIAQAENEAGVKLKSVIVGVDVPFLNSILMQGKLVSKNKRFKVSESDDDKLLKLSLKDVSCTGYTLCHCAPNMLLWPTVRRAYRCLWGARYLSLRLIFSHIFVSNDYVELVNDVLARRGLYANSYVAVPLAEIYTLIPPHASSKGALLIDMGYSHTDLTFVKNSMIVDMKVIHAGGKHFSNDLSKVLQIPLNVAENLKRRFVLGLDYDNGTECIPASEARNAVCEAVLHS